MNLETHANLITIDTTHFDQELKNRFTELFGETTEGYVDTPDLEGLNLDASIQGLHHGDVLKIRHEGSTMILFLDQHANLFRRAVSVEGANDAAVPVQLNALTEFHPRYWFPVIPEVTMIETAPLRQLLPEITTEKVYLTQAYPQINRRIGQSMVLPIGINGEAYYILGDYGFDNNELLPVETFLRDVLDGDIIRITGIDDELPELGFPSDRVLFISSERIQYHDQQDDTEENGEDQ